MGRRKKLTETESTAIDSGDRARMGLPPLAVVERAIDEQAANGHGLTFVSAEKLAEWDRERLQEEAAVPRDLPRTGPGSIPGFELPDAPEDEPDPPEMEEDPEPSEDLGEAPTELPEDDDVPSLRDEDSEDEVIEPDSSSKAETTMDLHPPYVEEHEENEGPDGYDEPAPEIGGLFDTASAGPVEVPAWGDYSRFPKTFQLRVERLRENGVAAYLGDVHTHSTMNQILAKYPFPGAFLLWPIDNMGKKITASPLRFDIDPAHSFFRSDVFRATQNGGAVGGPGPVGSPGNSMASGGISPEVMKLLEAEKAEAREARAEAERAKLAADEKERERLQALANREAELRDREMALSMTTSANLQESNTKMFESHDTRTNSLLRTLEQSAQREIERERAAAEREAKRQEDSFKLQMATLTSLQETILKANAQTDQRRMELEAEARKRDDESRREREKERDRYFKEREERIGKEEERVRELANEREKFRNEHLERMLTVGASGGMGNLVQQVEAIKTVTESLGLGDKEPKGIVGEIGDIYKEIKLAELELAKVKAQAKIAMVQGGMDPDDAEDEFDDDEDEGPQGSAQQAQRMPVPGGGFILPPLGPGQPARLEPPPGLDQAATQQWAQHANGYLRHLVQQQQAQQAQRALPAGGQGSAGGQSGGQAVQQPQQPMTGQGTSPQPVQQPVQNAGAPPAGAPASDSPAGRVAALPLQVQKEGRATVRALVKALAGTGDDKSKWQEIIMGGLKASPVTLEYLKAATIFGACVEGAKAERLENAEFLASDIAMTCEPFAQRMGIPAR